VVTEGEGGAVAALASTIDFSGELVDASRARVDRQAATGGRERRPTGGGDHLPSDEKLRRTSGSRETRSEVPGKMCNPPAGPTPTSAHPPSSRSPRSKALERGDLVNLVACFREALDESEHKVTDVQNRLIMQRIEAAEVLEEPVNPPSRQLKEISGIVAELVPLGQEDVEERLRACW
jgi:hypothetical protein